MCRTPPALAPCCASVCLSWLASLIRAGRSNPLRGGAKSPGDQVELVAFGGGKADPLVVVLAQCANLPGAQACQPISLGYHIRGLQVEVHAILDRLVLGDLVKHQDGSKSGAGSDRREVLSGAVVEGAVQGLGPKLRESGSVVSVKADCQYRDGHDAASNLRWC